MTLTEYTIERFERLDVDPARFDHAAHIYVARLFLAHYPEREAIDRFSRALRRLTLAAGAPEKYHATITGFYLRTIARRMATRPDDSWASFRSRNADLFDGSSLQAGYSTQRLASAAARRRFLEPDLDSTATGA
ncbi:MAG: hypothetical protein V2I25_11965 [Woeseiaceae bacterium]|jgi:hypothetical protein|nr:hypothetical protein [Woeseiaceae bacterium]